MLLISSTVLLFLPHFFGILSTQQSVTNSQVQIISSKGTPQKQKQKPQQPKNDHLYCQSQPNHTALSKYKYLTSKCVSELILNYHSLIYGPHLLQQTKTKFANTSVHQILLSPGCVLLSMASLCLGSTMGSLYSQCTQIFWKSPCLQEFGEGKKEQQLKSRWLEYFANKERLLEAKWDWSFLERALNK